MSEHTPYKQQAHTLVGRMVAHLAGRGSTFVVEANLDYGAPLFGKPFVEGARTYTTEEVIEAANRFLACVVDAKGVPDKRVATHFRDGAPALEGRGAARIALSQQNANGWFLVAAKAAGFRSSGPRYEAADAFRRAQSNVQLWTVKGLKGNFTTKKAAVSAGCRELHAADWKAANAMKDEAAAQAARDAIKARLVLKCNGEARNALRKGKQGSGPVTTGTPTATVSAAQAKTIATTMGATADDVKTKAAALAFLASKGVLLG